MGTTYILEQKVRAVHASPWRRVSEHPGIEGANRELDMFPHGELSFRIVRAAGMQREVVIYRP